MSPVGILVISTGDLSEALVRWATACFGPVAHLRSLNIPSEATWDWICEEVKDCIILLDKGAGVLIFTDIEGGSPFNASKVLIQSQGLYVRLIGGVNVPMLFKSITLSSTTGLEELSQRAVSYGKEHICLFQA